MKTLELFAGIGGIALGLETIGWETVAFSEYDPGKNGKPPKRQYAAEVFAARFPDAVPLGDITTLRFARNPEGIQGVLTLDSLTEGTGTTWRALYRGTVDIIAGGFPCQDISHAGKGAGIEHGERSSLWRHFAEAIAGIRPRGVLIENVAALAGRGLDRVLMDLASIGYDCEWDVIGAAGVGAPHLRERIFVIAWPQGGGVHGGWPAPPVFDNWLTEPEGVPRLVTESVPDRTARLRCLGNAVVPQVAAHVGMILADRIAYDRDDRDVTEWDAKHARGPERGESKFVAYASEVHAADAETRPMPEATLCQGVTKLPRAGRMTSGEVYERKRSCPQALAKQTGLAYMAATLRPVHPASPPLVPTPAAGMHNEGENPAQWLERRETLKAKGINGNGAGMPLGVAVKLIPTPTAKDADSSRGLTAVRETPLARASQPGETLTDYVDPTNGGRLLPTPQAADGDRTSKHQMHGEGTLVGAAGRLLPTPTVADATSGAGHAESAQVSQNLRTAAALLPTPTASLGNKSVRTPEGAARELERGKGGDLTAAVTLLPTPRVYDSEHRGSGPTPAELAGTTGMALASRVHLLPTPRASEWKGTGPLGSKSHEHRVEKGYLDATMQELEQRSGKLNADWVEPLMGFPAGWSVLP